MEIYTPTDITDPIYEGAMQSPVDGARAGETRVQIGRPEWWFLSDLFDEKWKPPQGDDTYLLVRLSYSLEPPRSYEVEEAHLSALLVCRGGVEHPVAFDLFPREAIEESQTDVKMTFGPSLKLEKIEGSLGSVETTIHIPKVEPIITTFGIGGSNPVWTFRKHRRHPILGSRMVYIVVAYPSKAAGMEIALDLDATVNSRRFGVWPLKVPEIAQAQLTYAIP
jgi:hypothetical protein